MGTKQGAHITFVLKFSPSLKFAYVRLLPVYKNINGLPPDNAKLLIIIIVITSCIAVWHLTSQWLSWSENFLSGSERVFVNMHKMARVEETK